MKEPSQTKRHENLIFVKVDRHEHISRGEFMTANTTKNVGVVRFPKVIRDGS